MENKCGQGGRRKGQAGARVEKQENVSGESKLKSEAEEFGVPCVICRLFPRERREQQPLASREGAAAESSQWGAGGSGRAASLPHGQRGGEVR